MQENACIIRNKELKDSITAMNSTTLRILSTAWITYCMVNSLRKIAFLSVINRRDAPPVSLKRDNKFDVSFRPAPTTFLLRLD